MTRDPRKLSEDDLQASVIALLRFRARSGVIFGHSPNGMPASARTGARFKRLGMKPGWADITIAVEGRMHCLELKTATGRQSPEQRSFQLECEIGGVPYAVARSFEEAERILSDWGCFAERRRAA
jgi:hypothetical protein